MGNEPQRYGEKKMFEKELYKLCVSATPWFKKMRNEPQRHRDTEKEMKILILNNKQFINLLHKEVETCVR